MDQTYSTQVEDKVQELYLKNLNWQNRLCKLVVTRKIILKWIGSKQVIEVWTVYIWLAQDQVEGFYENGNEPVVFH